MINEWEDNYYIIVDMEEDLKQNRSWVIDRGIIPNDFLNSYFSRNTTKYGYVSIETIDLFRLAAKKLFKRHIY